MKRDRHSGRRTRASRAFAIHRHRFTHARTWIWGYAGSVTRARDGLWNIDGYKWGFRSRLHKTKVLIESFPATPASSSEIYLFSFPIFLSLFLFETSLINSDARWLCLFRVLHFQFCVNYFLYCFFSPLSQIWVTFEQTLNACTTRVTLHRASQCRIISVNTSFPIVTRGSSCQLIWQAICERNRSTIRCNGAWNSVPYYLKLYPQSPCIMTLVCFSMSLSVRWFSQSTFSIF